MIAFRLTNLDLRFLTRDLFVNSVLRGSGRTPRLRPTAVNTPLVHRQLRSHAAGLHASLVMKETTMDVHPMSQLEETIERNLQCELHLNGDEAAPPPVGNLSIVFTDIKNSTVLWEASPESMLKALENHDRIMRKTIKSHGGYEVKVIGDAFMVAFPAAATALSWCLTVQHELLEAEWPQEILDHECGKEVLDKDGEIIFRGLSVRMGAHFGAPIDKDDEVTKRKDYIGPVVHRAARAIEVADGGQISVTREFLTGCQDAFSDIKGREDARHPCKPTF